LFYSYSTQYALVEVYVNISSAHLLHDCATSR
jgi:hypothetical protein